MATGIGHGSAGEGDGSQRRRPRLRILATLGAIGLGLATAQIVFATPPVASVSGPSQLPLEQSGTFTATGSDPADGHTITSFEWSFGDGATGNGPSVTHAYGTTGTKTVVVTVTDSNNETNTASATVVVPNISPTASFTASPTTASIGQTVSFNGTASADRGGSVTKYEWDLDGNGSFEKDTGASATTSTSYGTPGVREVKLRVTDNQGAVSDFAIRTVNVNNGMPVAALTMSPTTAQIGQNVTFDAGASADPDPGGGITKYEWDLDGDGTFERDTGANDVTSRSYDSPGIRTIKVRVTDNNGASGVEAKSLTVVNRSPVAGIAADPARAQIGQGVTFRSTSTDPDPGDSITTYEWDLGSGSFAAGGQTATTSFSSGGDKTIRLRVTDEFGGTDVETLVYHVNAKPVAMIVFAATNPPPGKAGVSLHPQQDKQRPLVDQWIGVAGSQSTDDGTIGSYAWDLDLDNNFGEVGEEGEGALREPYLTAGLKVVRLRVTDDEGAVSDIATATICVNRPPVADFSFVPQTPVTNEPITLFQTASDPDSSSPCLGDSTSGQLRTFTWDLDGDGAFGEEVPAAGLDETGPQATVKFTSPGVKPVALRVTDGGGAQSDVVKQEVDVQVTRPDAAFNFSPQDPLPGQAVTFDSASAPTAGKTIEKVEWDFDNDGRTFTREAEGTIVAHAFPGFGPKTVAVRVTETGGGFDVAARTIRVNAPPQASFRAAPSNPLVGDAMTFSSTSGDPDGPIQQAWDTDADGQFDDGTGAVATRTFSRPGTYTIALLVVDDRGVRAVASGQVRVVARPLASLRFLDATVAIAGRLKAGGADVTLLRVSAPAGARVVVKCFGKGKGCPGKRIQTRVLKRDQTRFRRFERNLAAGARITVAITMDGFIGRFTRFKIRAGKAPKRTDLCLHPGTRKPSACT